MIRFDRVGVTYDGAAAPVLRDVNLDIEEGELCLVIGHTGSGKSTLLGAVNGLVPHFTGGTLSGRVTVGGRDTARFRPQGARRRGVRRGPGQDPLAGFVTDTVEEELAYTMGAALRWSRPRCATRAGGDSRPVRLGRSCGNGRCPRCPGGQQQQVAIGAALTGPPARPGPRRALLPPFDPASAEEVLASITRLVHDLGVTVLLAEHRLERVVQYADRAVYLRGDGTVTAA